LTTDFFFFFEQEYIALEEKGKKEFAAMNK